MRPLFPSCRLPRHLDRAARRFPIEAAAVAPGDPPLGIENQQMEPAVVEQGAHAGMSVQHVDDGFAGRLDQHRQPQRIVDEPLAVMDRLPGQADARRAAVAFQHADPTHDIVQELVAGTEGLGATTEP